MSNVIPLKIRKRKQEPETRPFRAKVYRDCTGQRWPVAEGPYMICPFDIAPNDPEPPKAA